MSMRRWGRAIRPGDTEAQRWPCSCGVADREGGLGAWRVLQVPGVRGFGGTRGAEAVWVGGATRGWPGVRLAGVRRRHRQGAGTEMREIEWRAFL